jgi:hypothetical protein
LKRPVVAQQAALEAERELRAAAETERDRLQEAYEALKIQVELAHRRLVIAKAERVDTAQLELKFAATLLSFDGRDVRRLQAARCRGIRIPEPVVTGDAARRINERAFADPLAGIDLEPVSRRDRVQ